MEKMTETIIQYDAMVQMALLSVVRDVMHTAADKGLPGDHHFYITFSTNQPGTVIPPYLKERYPDEMTIVIQNQFSNLVVDDEHFEISLSFNGKLEHLYIPFLALQGFFDPSVDFGLHFHATEEDNDNVEDLAVPIKDLGEDTAGDTAGDTIVDITPVPVRVEAADNVVALDTFRKK